MSSPQLAFVRPRLKDWNILVGLDRNEAERDSTACIRSSASKRLEYFAGR